MSFLFPTRLLSISKYIPGGNLTLCDCMPCAARAFSKMLARRYCCETQLWEKTKAGSELLSPFLCVAPFTSHSSVWELWCPQQEGIEYRNSGALWIFGSLEGWKSVAIPESGLLSLSPFYTNSITCLILKLVIKSWNLEFVSVYRKSSSTPRPLALIWPSKLR